MNDYARGALEAMTYVEPLMTQLDRFNPDEKWKQLQSQVIGAKRNFEIHCEAAVLVSSKSFS
jgi:hypothetical protein